MLLKIGAVFLAFILSAGATALVALEPYGVMTVDFAVDDVSFRTPVPLGIVALAIHFVPESERRQIRAEFREFQPLVEAALTGLMDCEDGVLVDVVDHRDHVLVAKQGGSLIVKVDTSEERFHFQIPLRGARRVLASLTD